MPIINSCHRKRHSKYTYSESDNYSDNLYMYLDVSNDGFNTASVAPNGTVYQYELCHSV